MVLLIQFHSGMIMTVKHHVSVVNGTTSGSVLKLVISVLKKLSLTIVMISKEKFQPISLTISTTNKKMTINMMEVKIVMMTGMIKMKMIIISQMNILKNRSHGKTYSSSLISKTHPQQLLI
jgi:hypothetical protein